MGENLEYSSIEMSTSDLVAASVEGIQERYGQKYVSPELYLGTEMTAEGSEHAEMGLVRGVTPAVLLVRRQVEMEEGQWPKSGEVIVGRLAATKLGRRCRRAGDRQDAAIRRARLADQRHVYGRRGRV